MAPENVEGRSSSTKRYSSPGFIHRDPSLPASIPTTSRDLRLPTDRHEPEIPCRRRIWNFLYNKQKKTYCGRTCRSWLFILAYSVMYLIFLSTFTMVFLYGSLMAMQFTLDYESIDKQELLTYAENGIGLSATPTSETSYPLIWYRKNKEVDFDKYVQAIEDRIKNYRRKRDVNSLGPCGQYPYGYGESPCVLIRINKQFRWAGKPLKLSTLDAKSTPRQVQEWVRKDKKKLWLLCEGCNSYDKEHIGSIKYYPDPPGFDSEEFPLGKDSTSPLVAIQISNFTLGLSLAIECKLWYENGPSKVEFVIYVAPGDVVVSNRTRSSV